MVLARYLEMAAVARPQLFLAVVSLMLAAAAVVVMDRSRELRELDKTAAVMAALPQQEPLQLLILDQVAAVGLAALLTTAAQAAPASSFSNTTSALPRSSPSNPRRSGLRRLVRSALTTSLLLVAAVVEMPRGAVAVLAVFAQEQVYL